MCHIYILSLKYKAKVTIKIKIIFCNQVVELEATQNNLMVRLVKLFTISILLHVAASMVNSKIILQ